MELTRPDGSPLRVLVVDDEVNIAELIGMALRYEGWEVRQAHTGSKAVAAAKRVRPGRGRARHDAARLRRPGGAAPDARAPTPAYPSLFLTARDSVEDRVAGLTAGGDDYVTKPFSLEEVVARLRALMRRAGAHAHRPAARAHRGRPDPRRGQPRGVPRRRGDLADRDRVRAAPLPDAQPAAGAEQGARSSTGSGTTTSAARPTSSSSTSPTCARRSTPAASR